MPYRFDISKIDEEQELSGNDEFSNEVEEEYEVTFPRGTRFWQVYQGRTATGYGQVSKIWEVDSYLGDNNYSCKPMSDNTVGNLNHDYKANFNEVEINKILKDTPLI